MPAPSAQLPRNQFLEQQNINMPNQIKDIRTIDENSYPYIFEQNVSVPLKTGNGLIRANVYRPKGQEKSPVLVTYGPYGKDIPYEM